MVFYENITEPERVLIICADTGEFDAEASVDELSQLVKTAGGEVYASVIQKRPSPDNASYLGEGKLSQVREISENADIDLIVCDGQLSPVQQRNIEDSCNTRVIDRTMLILDIFALNARTNEGKIQVELAQLKYSLPRLSGKGKSLSRLGGGIGTRGPGESKLESDRRHIRRRIQSLEEELETIAVRRAAHREKRIKDGVLTAAIVGYTNAGKSTLLNALTDAGVLVEDKLFATLDPTSRAIKLPDGRSVLLIDTVGFISRLPHELVEAFKSTLEEAVCADVLINVCDASDEACEEQIKVTKKLLEELNAGAKPLITVYNKCDAAKDYLLPVTKNTVKISALKKIGLDRLLECVTDNLPKNRIRVLLLIPYSDGAAAARVRKDGAVFSEEFKPEGIEFDAIIGTDMLRVLTDYIIPAKNNK